MKLVIPQISPHEVRALQRLTARCARPGMIAFEVGTYTGASALAMLPGISAAGGMLYCVDWFRGNPGVGGHFARGFRNRGILRTFLDNVDQADVAANVTVVVGTSKAAASVVADGVADLVFIDADHRYSAVREDIVAWYPKVRQGGILCGHDHEQPLRSCDWARVLEGSEQDIVDGKHYGVIRAVGEFFPDVDQDGTIWFVEKTSPAAALAAAIAASRSCPTMSAAGRPVTASFEHPVLRRPSLGRRVARKAIRVVRGVGGRVLGRGGNIARD